MTNPLKLVARAQRAKAKAAGLTTYAGQRCRRNPSHGTMKYVTGGCVECSRTSAKARYQANIEQARAKSLAYARSRPEYVLWKAAQRRADESGLAFTISVEDIVIPAYCPVFGTSLTSPSLDRFDNDQGYTPDNIRVISRRANLIKSDATADEIEAVLRYMQNTAPVDREQLLRLAILV